MKPSRVKYGRANNKTLDFWVFTPEYGVQVYLLKVNITRIVRRAPNKKTDKVPYIYGPTRKGRGGLGRGRYKICYVFADPIILK